MDWEPLLAAAAAARAYSYSPFSHFAVGAAVQSADGTIFAGTNVENRSYGLALCAERAAVAAAVAAGHRDFRAAVVLAASTPPAPPCGLCRETLAEFCGPDLPILLANLQGARRQVRLGELFPDPFVLR
ncbi:MAG: cytidine deaminase [Thermoanaerobaculia bacterium]